jgi:hexosaminidase
MPVPASIVSSDGAGLPVTKSFSVAFAGHTDERLKSAVKRMIERLQRKTVLGLTRKTDGAPNDATLAIDAKGPAGEIPKLGDDESYTLTVTATRAVISAPTVTGAMRGMETFLQLVQGNRDGFFVPALEIKDSPRFPWRGLMIDCARHFQTISVIKRNIDAMAAVKMNVLHWHLTEDQGFRVESKKFPKLHTMGSDGNFYTQEEIRDIIRYAADRGIRVVPEFDMPGHATAWLVGHPELGSAPGPYEIERQPGIFEPALDPTNEEVYKLLDVFLGEMAALFPDAYLHIGGDENEGKQWDRNPKIQAFMQKNGIKDNHALQAYFNKRVLAILKKHGKIMMGWDEIFVPELPSDVVIHSWRGQEALAAAAQKGHLGVLSNGYYIDLMQPASDHYVVDPVPADSPLTAEEKKRVLGGEATMWSEWVTPETIDSRIWPRTAAIAERLWSPQDVRDVKDMYRRLDIMEVRLENLGLRHRSYQDMMLRRLTGSLDISDLRTLVQVIEPVKIYQRYQQRPQTMLDPLTGLIDAARPDAEGARRFSGLVDEFLASGKDPAKAEMLRRTFVRWQAVGTGLSISMNENPGLMEGAHLALDLRDLGTIGLEALEAIKTTSNASDAWRDASLKRIEEIAKPKAACEFVVIDAMKKLIQSASQAKTDQ